MYDFDFIITYVLSVTYWAETVLLSSRVSVIIRFAQLIKYLREFQLVCCTWPSAIGAFQLPLQDPASRLRPM